jgi:N6-L-threonylcarbamoyladenine synthase
MQVIGQTIDDAAGEAFDKSAKLLGLPYPGGPLIDKYAKEGNADAFKFPEPRITEEEKKAFVENNLADICASIQHRIISILLNKLKKAAAETGIKEVCMAGGVSANSGLRNALQQLGKQQGWNVYIPAFEYCTDNAAMIAITGYYKFMEKDFAGLGIAPTARAAW